MAIDWTAIANVVTGLGAGLGQPGQANPNANLNQMFQAQAQAKALKEQQEAEDKERKGKIFGSIGSTLGGLALAPLTGGMSIPAAAAISGAGSAAGGALGSMAGGGQPSLQDTLMNAVTGSIGNAVGGYATNALRGGVDPATQYLTPTQVPKGMTAPADAGGYTGGPQGPIAPQGATTLAAPTRREMRQNPWAMTDYAMSGGQVSQDMYANAPLKQRSALKQSGMFSNIPTGGQTFGIKYGDIIGNALGGAVGNMAGNVMRGKLVRLADGTLTYAQEVGGQTTASGI